MEKIFLKKKHIVKVPSTVSVYYCDFNNVILVTNRLNDNKKLLNLKSKLIIDKTKSLIKVTSQFANELSNNDIKRLKSIQVTYVSLLTQAIIDVINVSYKKLNFVGVGYRIFYLTLKKFGILQFKLGYSHSIYFKVPSNLKVYCLKGNKLFLKGNDYYFLTQIAATIKAYKMPDPYKGKGIQYSTEKLILKEGKKL